MTKQDNIVRRWSRRKLAAGKLPAMAEARTPMPELPALASLTPASDFRPFMDPRVDAALRRAALKRLFSHPSFNVIDAMDIYIADYTRSDPLPEEMLAHLQHARQTLFGGKDKRDEEDDESNRAMAAQVTEPSPADVDDEHGA